MQPTTLLGLASLIVLGIIGANLVSDKNASKVKSAGSAANSLLSSSLKALGI
jgi:hypothetical protein